MSYLKMPSGTKWFYRLKGRGKVLVFIHGWSFDSGVWSRQIDDFVDYKVVTLDLPGHGNSIDIVQDLNFIFKKLKLRNINLIGHSLGGLLALKFTLDYPHLVDSVILIGTNAKFVKSLDYEYGLSKNQINKLRGFITENYPDILLVFMRWLFTKEERSQSDFGEIWNLVSKRKTWPNKEALGGLLDIIEKEDLRSQLNKIKLSTLIISGTNDPICPIESTYYLNKHIKNSKVELFKNCGHLSFLTQSQRFNSLIREFIN